MFPPEFDFPYKPRYTRRDPIYQVFLQAYCLHPNVSVTTYVILEAVPYMDAIVIPRYKQRPPADTRYRTSYTLQELAQGRTRWELLQLSILEVSEGWEMDQEAPRPQREPSYQPTAHDMLTRFIKHFAFITMVRADSYPMAVALGSCLFTYKPSDACLVADLNDAVRLHNIGKVPGQLANQLTKRFRPLFEALNIPSKAPDARERDVLNDAMRTFTPWGTICFQEPPEVFQQLTDAEVSERQRMHALLCTTCAGFAKLVTQWNAAWHATPARQLAAPETMLEVPVFANRPPANPDDPTPFTPEVDNDTLNVLRSALLNTLKASSQRRRAHPFELLRVCVDGVELGQVGGTALALQSFRIPVDAIRVQVFGKDATGEIPVGVFYISDLAEDEVPAPLYHVMESGATLALTLTPPDAAETRQIELQVWPEESLVPKTAAWYEAAVYTAFRGLELAKVTDDTALETDCQQRLRGLHRSLRTSRAQGGEMAALAERLGHWLIELSKSVMRWVSAPWTPHLAGVPSVAAAIPEDTQTFPMEEGEITVTCRWGAADQGTAAYIDLRWRADFAIAGDIWVQFRQPDTGALLVELQLGTDLSGEASFTYDILGFDPSREPWGLAMMLKEVLS